MPHHTTGPRSDAGKERASRNAVQLLLTLLVALLLVTTAARLVPDLARPEEAVLPRPDGMAGSSFGNFGGASASSSFGNFGTAPKPTTAPCDQRRPSAHAPRAPPAVDPAFVR